jgi:AraC family transcriptional regulator, transcriptional activator of pobA
MEKIESLEAFYQRKFDWMPDNLKNEIGHFNVFNHEPVEAGKSKPIPYKRRDFYKMMLVVGNVDLEYADKVVAVKKQALFFSNPQIPYRCQQLDKIKSGVYCIFNAQFFYEYTKFSQYLVFQPNGDHVFELTDEQVAKIQHIYDRMFEEINSDYVHKYDVLRNLALEILHFAMKMQPSANFNLQAVNASQRISALFLELLERQFPIDENHPAINLRAASDFANQ